MKNLNSRPFIFGFSVALVILLTAVYWNHFDNGFHFDDSHTIVSNSYIREVGNIPLFFQDARTTSTLPPNQAYRPMVTSLNAIDFWFTGTIEPKVFHWHIFLEFVLLLGFFYLFLVRLFEKVDGRLHRLVALLTTTFFAFHAATAETINYVIARSDGFSTLMVVAGMLIYISSKDWKRNLALIPFILGCLTKPTALMLFPLLAVYELLIERPSILIQTEKPNWIPKIASALKRTAPFLVVGLGMYLFTQSMASDTWIRNTISSPTEYLNTQLYVIGLYVKTFFLPTHLSADPDIQLIPKVFTAKTIGGLLVILFLLILAFRFAKQRQTLPVSFGILWFFIALIPSSSVVPLADVMNHHRTFFSYLGLTFALAWGVHLAFQKLTKNQPSQKAKLVLGVIVALAIGANAYGTFVRNQVWDNEESLWKDVAEKSPNNGRGLMAYGMQLLQKGEKEAALDYLTKASKTSFGNHPYLVVNLARCHAALGHNELAKKYFELSITGGDYFPECHYHYAIWLASQGDLSGAHQQLEKLLQISPSHRDGIAIMQRLEAEMAKRSAQKPVGMTAEKYLALSLQYYQMNRFEECIQMCEMAISLRPDYADAYNNMCSAYNKLKQYDKAIAACEKAVSIRPDFELAKNNLNWSKRQLKK